MFRKLIFLFLLIILSAPTKSVWAAASDWQGIEEAQVRLISASSTLGDGKNLIFGLHFKMQEDWKVYWRSPGDAGFPPELTWREADRISSEMLWPKPERFEVLGLQTLGYKDEVVYPLVVNVENSSSDLLAGLNLNFLTCSDICVPVSVDLEVALGSGDIQFTDEAQLINKYKSQVPLKGETNGVNWHQATVYKDDNGKDGLLRVTLNSDQPIENPDAIAEGPIELVFQNPVIEKNNETAGHSYILDFPFDGFQFLTAPLGEKPFIITLMGQSHSVEVNGPIEIKTGPVPSQNADQTSAHGDGILLWQILFFAILGGFILNAMPCVLPVLSIKVLGVINHGGGDLVDIRKAFLASTAGIVFSFMVLAGFLITLKASGAAIGWGIQFQEPLFLIALSLIILLFACNLWGLFEINLPSSMSNIAAVEQNQKSPVVKHFLTGAFATLLATPCSAPFLGTAVGFALSRGTGEILMVFLALGLGLAIPYILLALNPKWVSRLPKPGPWMNKLRLILGFALLATAIWLISVLFVQIGLQATLVLVALFSAIMIILFARKNVGRIAVPLVLAMAVSAFIVPKTIANTNASQSVVANDHWVVFDKNDISNLVSSGKVVFVDVTADWCITCQVNKKIVLDQDPIYQQLAGEEVIALKADWTSPDQEIADYLASFSKFGIPFNVVYGPGAPEGIVLPEILTSDKVQQALDQASQS